MVSVLAWVSSLVVQEVQELPDTKGNKGSQHWTNPVNPVVVRERTCSDTWTKRSSWVQTGTSVVHTNQVSNEQGDTNSQWGHKCSLVLLNSHEQDSGTQKTGTESFKEETSGSRTATTKAVGKGDWTRSHSGCSTGSSHTCNHLGNHHQNTSLVGWLLQA